MSWHAPLAGLYAWPVRAPEPPHDVVAAPPCPVCGAREARIRFEVEGLASHVLGCDGCGLARVHPLPTAEEIRAFYPDAYYGEPGAKFQPAIERLVRWVGSRHLDFLTAGLPAGARVLDVGCGRGVVLNPLAARGFEVHGVEIGADAARGVDPRAAVRVATHLRDAGYPAGHFDQLVLWHALEHLPDPRGTLEEAHRILRPHGRLLVAVPNLASLQARWSGPDWFHLDLPRHLYHFPLGALRRLLEDTGFETLSEHHFSLRQNPFGWIQSALNRFARRLPRNGLYVLLQRRPAGAPPPYTASERRRLWLGLALLALPALALTLLETALRSGATAHLVARRGGS